MEAEVVSEVSQTAEMPGESDAEDEAARVVASLKQLAQETVSRAEAEAKRLREEAAKEKERSFSEVRGQIEAILSAAKDEAARVIADARRKAEEEANDIVARARLEAERLTKGLADRTDQLVGSQEHARGLTPKSPHAAGKVRSTVASHAQSVAPLQDDSVLYYGELELPITGTPDEEAVSEFEAELRKIARLAVTGYQVSESGRGALRVHARAATPLLRIVRSLSIVKDAVPAGKDIEVTLRSG